MSAGGTGRPEEEAGAGSAPDLRPLGIGEVLDVSIKVYTRHAVELFKPVAIVIVPIQVVILIVLFSVVPASLVAATQTGQPPSTDPFGDPTPAQIAAFVSAGLVFVVGSIVASVLATGASFKAVSDAYLGARPEWRSSLEFVARRLHSLLWITVLGGLAILLGTLALIVPGVYLGLAFQLATPVLLAEGLRGTSALRRSVRLVRHRWWPTFGVILLGGLLAAVVSFVIGAVIGLPAGFLSLESPIAGAVLNQLAQIVSTVLVLPFQAAIVAVVYFDLRVRKEGFDLELLAREVGTTPGADAGMGVATRPAPGAAGGPPPTYGGPPPTGGPGGAPPG